MQEAQDSDSDTEGGATGGEAEMDFLRNLFTQTLGLGSQKERLLDELTLEGVTRYMQSERCRKVICLVGAGISTSAGIPDFRSPSTGLYANLEKYHLPYPEAIFEISYFKKHPEPFFALAKELYPGQFKPTICHYFIRLLKEKGLLLRCYTQNIDTLERVAGLEPQDLVEAHGTFYTSHCVNTSCRKEYTMGWMKEKIFSEATPRCEQCQSVVKPDIVFFGENLPSRFFSCMQSDFSKVDLLIIMGTSLQVQPFASLISKAPLATPRLLINKEKTGQVSLPQLPSPSPPPLLPCPPPPPSTFFAPFLIWPLPQGTGQVSVPPGKHQILRLASSVRRTWELACALGLCHSRLH